MPTPANKRFAVPAWLRWPLCLCIFLYAWLSPALAQDLQPVPPLTARVVDQTGTLSTAQQQALESRLREFEQRKGSQIAVLIVPRTAPETIEQYGIRVAEQWKLGRRKVDDGAILLIAKDERALRIEVGYGLEGAMNDATAKRIVDEIIVPHFRNGDFAGGVEAGVDTMIRVIDGEPLPEPPARGDARYNPQDNPFGLLPLLFVAALMLGGLMRALLGRGKGALVAGGLLGLGAWLLSGAIVLALFAAFVGFMVTLAGGQMGSGWRGGHRWPGGGWGSGGGWDRGGGGGGGFRGGGGGFGGGGASGRW